jgi:hypothetical protein
MSGNQTENPRRSSATVVLALLLCMLVGVMFLALSSPIPISLRSEVREVFRSLIHDLGIAFCVSAVVAGLIEIARVARHRIETMKDVIDLVMSDLITSEVWMELKDLIEAKTVIRRSVKLRMELQSHEALDARERILIVEQAYDLFPLRNRPTKHTIRQDLDYQLNRPALNLPRWDQVVVIPPSARTNNAKIDLESPRLSIDVSLQARGTDEPVFIQTRRSEFVSLPGSYNFYMSEFVKGLHLTLVGCPAGFQVEVEVRPHGGGQALINQDNTWSNDQLVFPGQGIEVKFIKTETSAGTEATTAPAAR